MNEKRVEWLNQNRYRAYPFINDKGLVCNGKRVPDCILLDCLVSDTRSGVSTKDLTFSKYVVEDDKTTVYFKYDGKSMSCTISDDVGSSSSSSSDEIPYVRMTGRFRSDMDEGGLAELTFIFSRHDYIREHAGTGTWEFTGKVLPTRVVTVASTGVSGISTNGSDQVRGGGTATGTVRLIDGYRTSPVIRNGKVVVRVGKNYGEDPCHYKREQTTVPCDKLMFFFCGQNAINSGNVVIKGGPGVSISQTTYKATRDIPDSTGSIGIKEGEEIPCISIAAASELIRIYTPSGTDGSSSY